MNNITANPDSKSNKNSAFLGANNRAMYFEGWYLKHQHQTKTLSLIPAFHVDGSRHPSASIQVISDTGSHSVSFPSEYFSASKNRFHIRVGNNIFTETGICVNLKTEEFAISGSLGYSPLKPPKTDVMGPFRHIPFMQCYHGVLSFAHSLSGSLIFNGEAWDFSGGVGYIEKDWGSSFPSGYLWTQCCWHEKEVCSVMLSIADIPFLGSRFTGCICTILYDGKEYRLATYNGVRIIKCSRNGAIIKRGKYRFEVSLLKQNPFMLQAPERGNMSRTIRESPSSTVRYRFSEGEKVLFDIVNDRASYEYAEGERQFGKTPY